MKKEILIAMAALILMSACAPSYKEEPMPILTEPVYEEQDPASNPGSHNNFV